MQQILIRFGKNLEGSGRKDGKLAKPKRARDTHLVAVFCNFQGLPDNRPSFDATEIVASMVVGVEEDAFNDITYVDDGCVPGRKLK